MQGYIGFRYVIAWILVGSFMLSAGAAQGSSLPADAVLGQPDFSSFGCNQGSEQPSATTLCEPSDVSMDPTSGRLFVADAGNHRVLSWPNTHRLGSGEPADLVLGQSDLETAQVCDVPNAGCFEPAGLTVDDSGSLFVSDRATEHVLRFSPPFANGQAPDLVLGAVDLGSHDAIRDFRGDLFAVEPQSSRVLRTNGPNSGTTQPSSGGSATIVVTTTEDELTINGRCSLREAIRAANLSSAVDSCPAGRGDNTIILPSGLYMMRIGGPGEDLGLTGDLDITGKLTIRGTDATTTIVDASNLSNVDRDGSGRDRVFHVLVGADVGLERLTIRGGTGGCTTIESDCPKGNGGGVLNEGTLAIRQSIVAGNSVHFGFKEPVFAGGGIANTGRMTITDSTISDNRAGDGGGILNTGELEIIRSAVTGNSTTGSGAGDVVTGGDGGGIENAGRLSIANSTISANVTTEGINTNGGGIANTGALTIRSSTVANNSARGLSAPSPKFRYLA